MNLNLPPTPDELRSQIYLKMVPAQKLEEAFRLRDVAWTLKASFLRSQNPDWSEDEIQAAVRKIFLYAFT